MPKLTTSSGNCFPASRIWSKSLLMIMGFCCVLMLWGCASSETESTTEAGEASAGEQAYDSNSWKTVIAKDCQRFTDGCNNCVRNLESGVAACTRRACVAYSKPECLDGLISGSAGTQPKIVTYRCESDNQLVVSYGRYEHNGKSVELQPGQIILRDVHDGSAHLLNRVRSASGELYQGRGLEFWSKGIEAMLRRNGRPVYLACVQER